MTCFCVICLNIAYRRFFVVSNAITHTVCPVCVYNNYQVSLSKDVYIFFNTSNQISIIYWSNVDKNIIKHSDIINNDSGTRLSRGAKTLSFESGNKVTLLLRLDLAVRIFIVCVSTFMRTWEMEGRPHHFWCRYFRNCALLIRRCCRFVEKILGFAET